MSSARKTILTAAWAAAALVATGTGSASALGDEPADLSAIAACTEDVEAPCDMKAFRQALGLLEAAHVLPFRDHGMETFAMLTALRYAASALYFADEGEGCYAEEERGAAFEIWAGWVKAPEGLPADLEARYAMFQGVMDRVAELEIEC